MSDKKKMLPKKARRVFKGVIFDVWQWKQKMYDGSTAVFEKLSREDTCNIIATVGNKILILKQRQPDWKKDKTCVAGGRIGEKEKPLEAAKRELLEETGYAAKDWVFWRKQRPYGKIVWDIFTFVARNAEKIQKPQPDGGEKIKTKLVTFEEFLQLSEDPSLYEGELKSALFRARLDKKYRDELYKLFFKK